MPRRPHPWRVLGDHQAVLADAAQQGGVPRRVGHVDATGQYRDGQAVSGKRAPVGRPVDAVRAARHHGDVPACQTIGEVGCDVLTVGGARPGADDRRGPVGDIVQPARPHRPQHHRRMAPRALAGAAPVERGERQQRPFLIVGGDQPPAETS